MKNVIYRITDHKGRIYIGSSVDFNKRKNGHLQHLRKNNHHSPRLQNVFNKYGLESLKFEIIEQVENSSLLIEREQYYLDSLKPFFNVSPTAGSPLGVKHSEAVKKAHSERRKGVAIHDEAFKKALAERNSARIWTDEAKRKDGDAKRGKKQSAEWVEMIKRTNTGRKFTASHKEKISVANKGKPFTEKMRLGVVQSNRNRVFTDEMRQRMSVALTGRPCSEESRRKRSETMKQTLLKKKQNACNQFN